MNRRESEKAYCITQIISRIGKEWTSYIMPFGYDCHNITGEDAKALERVFEGKVALEIPDLIIRMRNASRNDAKLDHIYEQYGAGEIDDNLWIASDAAVMAGLYQSFQKNGLSGASGKLLQLIEYSAALELPLDYIHQYIKSKGHEVPAGSRLLPTTMVTLTSEDLPIVAKVGRLFHADSNSRDSVRVLRLMYEDSALSVASETFHERASV